MKPLTMFMESNVLLLVRVNLFSHITASYSCTPYYTIQPVLESGVLSLLSRVSERLAPTLNANHASKNHSVIQTHRLLSVRALLWDWYYPLQFASSSLLLQALPHTHSAPLPAGQKKC